jgi:hypothetical protein
VPGFSGSVSSAGSAANAIDTIASYTLVPRDRHSASPTSAPPMRALTSTTSGPSAVSTNSVCANPRSCPATAGTRSIQRPSSARSAAGNATGNAAASSRRTGSGESWRLSTPSSRVRPAHVTVSAL